LAVATPGGDPLAPFVVGNEGGDDKDYDKDGEKNLHTDFRIA
jgi:hypothetical protein